MFNEKLKVHKTIESRYSDCRGPEAATGDAAPRRRYLKCTALALAGLMVGVAILAFGCNSEPTDKQGSTLDSTALETIDNTQQEALLTATAELADSTEDAAAIHMAELASEYIDNQNPEYISGALPMPNIRFFKIDFYGRESESYFLVWLPDDWEEQKVKEAIVYSQGHGSRKPQSFSDLHQYAVERDVAIFMPQLWIEGEAPPGYRPWKKGPKDRERGLPNGYHLKAEDEFMFLNSIVDEYGVDSVYLYGFSISGAMVMQIAAYDRYGPNVVDLTVVSGGGMYYGHHFIRQMEELGLEQFLQDENFFFFGEIGNEKVPEQEKSETDSTEIIVENGGNLVMEEWRMVHHGGLHKQLHELMNESLDLYEEILAERIGRES